MEPINSIESNQEEESVGPQPSELETVFAICDTDGDGVITRDDLEILLSNIGFGTDLNDFVFELPESFTLPQLKEATDKYRPPRHDSTLISSVNSVTPRSLAGSSAGVDHSDCNYALHELNSKNSSLSKQLLSLETQCLELSHIYDDLKKTEKSQSKELRKLQVKFSSVAAELEAVKQVNKDMTTRELELKQQLREMKDQQGDIEDALHLTKAELRAAYEAKIRANPSATPTVVPEETLSELQKANETLEKLQIDAQQLRRANAELQRIHSEDELQIKVLDARIERLNIELESKDGLIAELGVIPDKPTNDRFLNTWHGRTVAPLFSELETTQNQPIHPSLMAARTFTSSLDSAYANEKAGNAQEACHREQDESSTDLPLSRSTSCSGNAADNESVTESDNPTPVPATDTGTCTDTEVVTETETEAEQVSDDHAEHVAKQLLNVSDIQISTSDVSPRLSTPSGLTDTTSTASDLEPPQAPQKAAIVEVVKKPKQEPARVDLESPTTPKREAPRSAETVGAQKGTASPKEQRATSTSPSKQGDLVSATVSSEEAVQHTKDLPREGDERVPSYKDALLKADEQLTGRPKVTTPEGDYKVPLTVTTPPRKNSNAVRNPFAELQNLNPFTPTTPPSTSPTALHTPSSPFAPKAHSTTPPRTSPVSHQTPATPFIPFTPVTPQRDLTASTPRRAEELLTTDQLYAPKSASFRAQDSITSPNPYNSLRQEVPFTTVSRKSDALRSKSELSSQSKPSTPTYKPTYTPVTYRTRSAFNHKSGKVVTADQAYELHEYALKAGLIRPRPHDYVPRVNKASQVDSAELETGVAFDGTPKDKRFNSRRNRSSSSTSTAPAGPPYLDRKIMVRGNPYLVRLLSYPDPAIDSMEEIVAQLEAELSGIEQSMKLPASSTTPMSPTRPRSASAAPTTPTRPRSATNPTSPTHRSPRPSPLTSSSIPSSSSSSNSSSSNSSQQQKQVAVNNNHQWLMIALMVICLIAAAILANYVNMA